MTTKSLPYKNCKECLRKGHGINKLRAAIYARKSAEDKQQTSLETQIAVCKNFISQQSCLQLAQVFQEDDVSGMFTDNRLEYQKMMSLAENGEIDVIVVMKLDRLARDAGDAHTAIKLLRMYDCYLIAGDDVPNANTPAGEFMRGILMLNNQYHVRRVATDVIITDCNQVKRGYTAGGVAPYGLTVIGEEKARHFVIDENEAPAIRTMFTMYAQGCSYKQIIDELSAQGYKTRKGETFSYATLNSLLRNDKFYGTYVYNREGAPKKKHRSLIGHFDEVRNPDAIPPIITKELFDKVQARLAANKEHCLAKQNQSPEYLLTGLLYCKHCGSSMSGNAHTGRTKSNSLSRIHLPQNTQA